MNVRLQATLIIDKVANGASLSDLLPMTLENIPDKRDRALLQAIVYGVCRYYTRLDAVLSSLLKKPMDEKDSDVFALLLVGLYQLMEMRIPEHAAVSETVSVVKALKKDWARGFVNAILREYLRQKDVIAKKIERDDEALYAHPQWWITAFKKNWPTEYREILLANNAQAPLFIRVNSQKISRDDYLKLLHEKNIAAKKVIEVPHAILLEHAVTVDELPNFSQGFISVQDAAAQIAAELLDIKSDMRILDACAAPGGKLTHILELEPNNKVIAVEKDKSRTKLIKENLQRLQLSADIIVADADDVTRWWDQQSFDRILIDAPCSASGVIRRHPDIKVLRQANDIKNLAFLQLKILNALWPTLKANGLLVYATCSIFPEENVEVIKKFLSTHTDVREDKIVADWGLACEFGRQILPGMHDMDGFYYARLRKLY